MVHKGHPPAPPQPLLPFDLLAEGWSRDPEPGFMVHVGPVYVRLTANGEEIGFQVEPHHLNRNGVVHGGMLATLFDHAVGSRCFLALGQEAFLATIQISTHFIREALPGDFVTCEVEVTRVTSSVLFLRGICRAREHTILTGEAIVKRRRRAHPTDTPKGS